MSDIFDGGSAFPIPLDDRPGAYPAEPGMSKRELFAVILMHSEAVTCAVPGEACDALGKASQDAGDDVIDHMAGNAVDGADALLRALGAPRPPQNRELSYYEQEQLKAADRLAAAVSEVQKVSAYLAIPAVLREPLERALEDVTDPAIPF